MTNMRANRVKSKLAAGERAAVLSGLPTPDLIDLVGPTEIDGVWIEAEHGDVDFSDIADHSRAADLWGKTPIVRVNQNDEALIYRTLDRGAQGIVVPHVNTREEAEAVVQAAKFAPIGRRGMFTSRQGYGVSNYFSVANDHTLLIVLIEDIEAVNNLDEILSVDNIDVFFVAPSDLAQTMGHIGDNMHPDVQSTVADTLTRINNAGRCPGTLATDGTLEHVVDLGARFIMQSINAWLENAASDYATKINGSKG